MTKIIKLIKNDFVNINRDKIMLILFVFPIIFSLIGRFIVPETIVYLFEQHQIDLKSYYFLIKGYFFLFTPLMIGIVTGLMILDEKDGNIIQLLSVTPLSIRGYIQYRAFIPFVLSGVYSFVTFYILARFNISIFALFGIAILNSLSSLIFSLILGILANNKIEGLTMAKIINILILAPLAEIFIDEKLMYIVGLTPFYWTVKVFVLFAENNENAIYYLAIGIFVNLVYCLGLMRIFINKFTR